MQEERSRENVAGSVREGRVEIAGVLVGRHVPLARRVANRTVATAPKRLQFTQSEY